ncbi:MAG: hypothetical protein ACRDQ2_10065 [Gaiellales bacterium]
MPYTITHTSGAMDQDPPVSALRVLVDELASADVEHPDVAVADESGWALSAFKDGRVVWENVEEDVEPRHLEGVDRERLVTMFEALARGDVASIEANSWMPGY